MTGQGPTNSPGKWTRTHLKPGRKFVHIQPGQKVYQPQAKVGSHQLPAKVVNQPLQAEAEHQPPQEVLLTHPQADEERVMAPGLTGTRWPCENPEVESLSPRGLPT